MSSNAAPYLCVCGHAVMNTKDGVASHLRGSVHREAMEAQQRKAKAPIQVCVAFLYARIIFFPFSELRASSTTGTVSMGKR